MYIKFCFHQGSVLDTEHTELGLKENRMNIKPLKYITPLNPPPHPKITPLSFVAKTQFPYDR